MSSLDAMRDLLAQRRSELYLRQFIYRSNEHARLARACVLQEIAPETAKALHVELDAVLDRVEQERAFDLARKPQGVSQ